MISHFEKMEMVKLAKVLSTREKLHQIGKMFIELDQEIGTEPIVEKTIQSIKFKDYMDA